MRRALAAVVMVVCAGCGSAHHADETWFRIYGEGGGPVLNAGDVARETVRLDMDPATGQPVLTFGLTAEGLRKFNRLTRTLAHRGASVGRPFHFLITVDGRVLGRPYIDYRMNPDGIPGGSGIQLNLPSRSESEKLARRLRGG
jgi:preprotein translocase subunit SecD